MQSAAAFAEAASSVQLDSWPRRGVQTPVGDRCDRMHCVQQRRSITM